MKKLDKYKLKEFTVRRCSLQAGGDDLWLVSVTDTINIGDYLEYKNKIYLTIGLLMDNPIGILKEENDKKRMEECESIILPVMDCNKAYFHRSEVFNEDTMQAIIIGEYTANHPPICYVIWDTSTRQPMIRPIVIYKKEVDLQKILKEAIQENGEPLRQKNSDKWRRWQQLGTGN